MPSGKELKMNILIYNWRDIRNLKAGGAEVFTLDDAKSGRKDMDQSKALM